MTVRALAMGALGLLAVAAGTAFLGFHKAAWIIFGAAYALIGILYLTGKSGFLLRSLGPGLSRLASVNGAALAAGAVSPALPLGPRQEFFRSLAFGLAATTRHAPYSARLQSEPFRSERRAEHAGANLFEGDVARGRGVVSER